MIQDISETVNLVDQFSVGTVDWIIEDVELMIDHRMLLVFDIMYDEDDDDDIKKQNHKGHICSTGAPIVMNNLSQCLQILAQKCN